MRRGKRERALIFVAFLLMMMHAPTKCQESASTIIHGNEGIIIFGATTDSHDQAYIKKDGHGILSVNHTLKVSGRLLVGSEDVMALVATMNATIHSLNATINQQSATIATMNASITSLKGDTAMTISALTDRVDQLALMITSVNSSMADVDTISPGAASSVDLKVAAGSVTAGKIVSSSMGDVVGGLPITNLCSNTILNTVVAQTNGSQLVAAFCDQGDGGLGKFRVVESTTGSSVTNETIFSAGSAEHLSIAVVPSSTYPAQFLIGYQDTADSNKGKVTIRDTTAAVVLASVAFTTNDATEISVTMLTSSRFVVAYRDDSDGGKGKFFIGKTENGAQVTAASDTFDTGDVMDISVSRLSDTKFMVAYSAVSDSMKGKFWMWDMAIGANGQQTLPPTVFNLLPTSNIRTVAVSATQSAVIFEDDSTCDQLISTVGLRCIRSPSPRQDNHPQWEHFRYVGKFPG